LKRFEQLNTVYVDEEGNILSGLTDKEIKEREKKGLPALTTRKIHIRDEAELRGDKGQLIRRITVEYNYEKGNTYAEVLSVDLTDKPKIFGRKSQREYYYFEDGNGDSEINVDYNKDGTLKQTNDYIIKFEKGKAKCIKCPTDSTQKEKLLKKANRAQNQFESRQIFKAIDFSLTEFSGLSYLPSLFINEDSRREWQERIDRFFAEKYLGTKYWTSAICRSHIDGEKEGVAYVETPQGLADVAAHVEGERTEPIIDPEGNKHYIYKITYLVKNGAYKDDPKALEIMQFSVKLFGERNIDLFGKKVKLKKGESFSRLGENAFVANTTFLYSRICLEFDEIPAAWTLDDKKLCNNIVETTKSPIRYNQGTQTTTSGEGTAGYVEVPI
jgi:hypothetical protein